jgi:hypothetical protein
VKLRLTLAGAALVALALPLVASAGSSTDRAQGGGQVLIGTRGGAGDTIAFTAQGTSSAATGQVQYVDRTATGQTTFHGAVQCLMVSGNMAKIAGTWRAGGTFQLLVVDNGQGSAASNDLVTLQNNQPNDCANDNDDQDNETDLARGNAQVYDAP